MVPNVVWLQKLRPIFAEKQMKTSFWGVTSKKGVDEKLCAKVAQKLFGQVSENSGKILCTPKNLPAPTPLPACHYFGPFTVKLCAPLALHRVKALAHCTTTTLSCPSRRCSSRWWDATRIRSADRSGLISTRRQWPTTSCSASSTRRPENGRTDSFLASCAICRTWRTTDRSGSFSTATSTQCG